jgi:hypothetical protein
MHATLIQERAITLSVEHDDGRVELANIPRPSVGWGGGTVVVSPANRYIAVVWDSGQSDAGYELFAVEPQLQRVGGLSRVYGSGAIVAFSPDERYLAMLSVVTPRLDAVETDEESEHEWAELRVQEIPNGPVIVCSVTTTMPPIEKEGDDSYYPEVLRFVSGTRLELAGPSGAIVAMTLPLDDSIEVEPPTRA